MTTGKELLAAMVGTDLCHIPARTIFQLCGVPLKLCHIHAFLDNEFYEPWIGRWCSISLVPSLSRSYSFRFYILEVSERESVLPVKCQYLGRNCHLEVAHIRNLVRCSVPEDVIFSHALCDQRYTILCFIDI